MPTFQHRCKAMLFDLDGTLVDSTEAIEAAWRTWSSMAGVEFGDPKAAHGLTARELLSTRVPAEHLESSLELLARIEGQPSAPIPIISGASRLLQDLPHDRWAIVTSSAGSAARARIRYSELRSPILLITADDVQSGKPNPEPYRSGASGLGVDPSECVAFEDTRAGLISARSAGCFTVAVGAGALLPDAADFADLAVPSFEAVTVEVRDEHLVVCFHRV